VVFLLVTLTLHAGLAGRGPEWWTWTAAAATSLLFFGSILLHELGHCVLALRHRVPVRAITLFFFGGVSQLERDPESARAEFEIALAGPVTSALLALVFLALAGPFDGGSVTGGSLRRLGEINLLVAVFNLLPGFPLDGGRVLRAALWARSGDPRRATRAAARAGQGLAYGFIGLGALLALGRELWVSGLWLAFLGWFLLVAAGAGARRAGAGISLDGLTARDVMSRDVAWINGSAPVGEFARQLVMHGRRWALVGEPGRLVGLVTLSDLGRVPRREWEHTTVGRIATPIDRVISGAPDQPVRDLLLRMIERRVNQIPILAGGRMVGAVTRETVVQALEPLEAAGGGEPA